MVDKNMYYVGIAILAILMLIHPGSAYFTNGTEYFTYLQVVNVNGSATAAQTNYPVYFQLYNTTGTSSGNTIYLNGKTINGFNDVRFTDTNDQNYSFWFDKNSTNTTYTGVWVNVTSIPIGTTNQTQVRTYYRNATATNATNGNNTFQAFTDLDNYASGALTGSWSNLRGNPQVIPWAGGKGIQLNYTQSLARYSVSQITPPVAMYTRSWATSGAEQFCLGFTNGTVAGSGNTETQSGYTYLVGAGGNDYIGEGDGSTGNLIATKTGVPTNPTGTWFGNTFYWNTTSLMGAYNNTNRISVTESTFNARTYLTIGTASGATAANYYTNLMYARKYVYPEPTAYTNGATELSLPIANFTNNVTYGTIPFNVLFNDTSTGGTPNSWYWEFGDGNTSTNQNVTKTYATNGLYSVNFGATNAAGTSWKNQTQLISSYSPNWSANITAGSVPLTVSFNDSTKSPDATGWTWWFGEGNSSTNRNNTVTYYTPGTYSVTLNVTNSTSGWYYNTTRNNYITSSAGIVADFTGTPLLSTAYVGFTDTSTGTPTAWAWNWGDGSGNSTSQNPGHTFPGGDGTYTITLTASKSGASDTEQKTGYVTIRGPTVAGFSANTTTGTAPADILFTDSSSGTITGRNWSFGDSTANSTDQNPTHTYTNAGTYTVTLTTINELYSSTETKVNYITISPAPVAPVAAFSGSQDRIECPSTVVFTDTSIQSPTSWYWEFGDGATSTSRNPTHVYTTAGVWDVNLQASNAYGNDWENKSAYITTTVIPPIAGFSGTPVFGSNPLTVSFTDASTHFPTTWEWNFGDGTANSTSQNPTHQFNGINTYDVVLTVTNDAGTSTECKIAYIEVSSSNYPTRVSAVSTVAPIDTRAYLAVIDSIGGNTTPANETDSVINFTGAIDAGMMPYTNIMGGLAWLLVIAIPISMIWIVQGKAWIPLILGIMLSGSLLAMGFIPADYAMPIMAFIGLSVAAIIYTLYKGD